MLGRLEMNINYAINAFARIMSDIFKLRHGAVATLFSALDFLHYSSATIDGMKKVIENAGLEINEEFRGHKQSNCKV
jgi:hypothetical protein